MKTRNTPDVTELRETPNGGSQQRMVRRLTVNELTRLAFVWAVGAVFTRLYMLDRQAEIDDGRGLDPLCDERD